jgi:hypothetical protein
MVEGIKVFLDIPSLTVDARLAHGALPMAMSDWAFFDPFEERIVRLLLDHDALSREQIATRLGESAEGKMKPTLASLVARRVLATGADGYRLNTTAEKRDELRGWFATRETNGCTPAGQDAGE